MNNSTQFSLAETQAEFRNFIAASGGATVREVFNEFNDSGYIPLEVGKKPTDTIAGILSGMTDLVSDTDSIGSEVFKLNTTTKGTTMTLLELIKEAIANNGGKASIPTIIKHVEATDSSHLQTKDSYTKIWCFMLRKNEGTFVQQIVKGGEKQYSLASADSRPSSSIHSLAVWAEKFINENGPMKTQDLVDAISANDPFHASTSGNLYHMVASQIHKSKKKFIKVAPGTFDLVANQKKIPVWKQIVNIFEANGNQPLHVKEVVEIVLANGFQTKSKRLEADFAHLMRNGPHKDKFEKTAPQTFRLAVPAEKETGPEIVVMEETASEKKDIAQLVAEGDFDAARKLIDKQEKKAELQAELDAKQRDLQKLQKQLDELND